MVAMSGNWVIEKYEMVSIYPKAAYIVFGMGWFLVVCAYVMNKLSIYQEILNVERKDNREFINKWERQGMPFDKWVIRIATLMIVLAAFHSWSLVIRLFWWYLFIGIVFIGFLYVMMGDRVENPDDNLDFTGKTKKFLDLIDY